MLSDIELYVGPAGSGKSEALSEWVLKEAHEHPDKNYILMVPDQSASGFEQRLIRKNDKLFNVPGLINVDIIGISRLSHRIFDEMDIRESEVLEEFEKNMMVRASASRVADKLEVFGGSIDKRGFISQAKSLISEFIQYDMTSEDIKMLEAELTDRGLEALRGKLHDIGLIYEDMRNYYLADGEQALAEERMKTLASVLFSNKSSKTVDGAVIAFDEFRGFTPDQFSVIRGLSGRAEKLIFSITMDTGIAKNSKEVKEHELYYQSYLTYEALKTLPGNSFSIKYFERGTDISRFKESSGIQHLEKSIFRFPIQEYKGDVTDIELWEAENPISELSVVAEDIRRSVRNGGRYRDYAIVTGDLKGLTAYASSVFADYDIPVFIDESRSLGKNPFTEGLIKLLQIIDRDFSYDTVFGFMKLGLQWDSITADMDVLENHCLKYGVRGYSMWKKPVFLPESKMRGELGDEMRDDARRSENARQQFLKLISPMTELGKGKLPVRRISDALRKMMSEDYLSYEKRIAEIAGLYESIKRFADARAMGALYDKLSEMLDSMDRLMGEEEVTVHTYEEMLASGTEDMKLGVIPPTLDAVTVADADRSRLGKVKKVYFINMNDGIIPLPRKTGRILSDRDKDCIEQIFRDKGIDKTLAPNDRMQSYMEQFFIYQTMTKPEEKLVMTYSSASREGAAIEPSYIIGRIKRIFPGLKTERKSPKLFEGTRDTDIYGFTESVRNALDMIKSGAISEETGKTNDRLLPLIGEIEKFTNIDSDAFYIDEDAVLYDNSAENIPAELLGSMKFEISVSKMESYARCPYSFFLNYILKLEKRREQKLEKMDIGNTLHRALELTEKRIKSDYKNDWKGIDEEELFNISDEALDTALKEWEYIVYERETDHKRNLAIRDELKDIMHRTVDVLRFQISKGSMAPTSFEQRFSATFKAVNAKGDEVPVVINGIIDRIDIMEKDDKLFFRVIDYKTGDAKFNPEEIKGGTKLQLTVYMDIIREILTREFQGKNVIPAGMYYYHVSNSDIKDLAASAVKKAGGDEEAAAVLKQRESLKLEGAANDSDFGEGREHDFLLLQDEDIIDAGGKLKKSYVIPVTPAGEKSAETYAKNASVANTEEMISLGLYGRIRMTEITNDIFAGRIDKHPIRYKGDQRVNCDNCNYKDICRFGAHGGKVNYIQGSKGSVREKIKSMTDMIIEEVEYDSVERITDKGTGKSEG